MEIKCLTEINYYAKRLSNAIDFKTEAILEKQVSMANRDAFERDIQRMLSFASELNFIVDSSNAPYATDCFKAARRAYAKVTGIISVGGTNEEFKEVIQTEMRNITDAIYLIESNPDGFKDIVKSEYFEFDKEMFKPIIEKIVVNKNEDREKLFVFEEELNGGDFLNDTKSILGKNNPDIENILLFGIDRDIEVGKKSRALGINTARKGLSACSDNWADIIIAANDKTIFDFESKFAFFDDDYSFVDALRRRLYKANSLFIFNIPFYRLDSFSRALTNYIIEGAYRTDDTAGNIIFILRHKIEPTHKNKDLMRKIKFQPQSLPSLAEVETIYLNTPVAEGPKNFRARFIDLDDVKQQFVGLPTVSEFIYDYLKPDEDDDDVKRALQETKEGHIPTLATSGIVSGRNADEVHGMNIGFDNLVETKIVKREIEEEEMVSVKGKMVKEISMKKSNIIVSTTISPEGEIIELFSNDTIIEETKK